jgi:hypothetical protein
VTCRAVGLDLLQTGAAIPNFPNSHRMLPEAPLFQEGGGAISVSATRACDMHPM